MVSSQSLCASRQQTIHGTPRTNSERFLTSFFISSDCNESSSLAPADSSKDAAASKCNTHVQTTNSEHLALAPSKSALIVVDYSKASGFCSLISPVLAGAFRILVAMKWTGGVATFSCRVDKHKPETRFAVLQHFHGFNTPMM